MGLLVCLLCRLICMTAGSPFPATNFADKIGRRPLLLPAVPLRYWTEVQRLFHNNG